MLPSSTPTVLPGRSDGPLIRPVRASVVITLVKGSCVCAIVRSLRQDATARVWTLPPWVPAARDPGASCVRCEAGPGTMPRGQLAPKITHRPARCRQREARGQRKRSSRSATWRWHSRRSGERRYQQKPRSGQRSLHATSSSTRISLVSLAVQAAVARRAAACRSNRKAELALHWSEQLQPPRVYR